MNNDRMDVALRGLEKLTDEEIRSLQFSVPWQYDPDTGAQRDPDDFPTTRGNDESIQSRETLQTECWSKFNRNPHVNTAVRGLVGRLTGLGFEVSSQIRKIQEAIEEVELDQRNRLYNFWPKYVGRAIIEGELFVCLTVHVDGFIEVDFIDPSVVCGGTGDGVIYHPNKTTLPLLYYIRDSEGVEEQIPSIFIARYPELLTIARKDSEFQEELLRNSKAKQKVYKKVGGFYRFVVAWDKSFVTRRNTSYLRTIIKWLNHYEALKNYEIDHKKSSGAYLWIVSIEDAKAFRMWLSLSDEDKRKTGIMAKKTPGSTMVLPPGMKMTVVNPTLPKITETDTDILHMVTSGLNEPEDIATGQSKGTFASVKASRGPMSDRVSDEIAYFERFLRYDFYGNIFFLKSVVSPFPSIFKREEVIDFKKQNPVFGTVSKTPESLIDISFPVSEINDAESRAKAYMGVKHGSTDDTLGIPKSDIAKKLGFGNYNRKRLEHATEEAKFPPLLPALDAETEQEKKIEPKKPVLKKTIRG